MVKRFMLIESFRSVPEESLTLKLKLKPRFAEVCRPDRLGSLFDGATRRRLKFARQRLHRNPTPPTLSKLNGNSLPNAWNRENRFNFRVTGNCDWHRSKLP